MSAEDNTVWKGALTAVYIRGSKKPNCESTTRAIGNDEKCVRDVGSRRRQGPVRGAVSPVKPKGGGGGKNQTVLFARGRVVSLGVVSNQVLER